MANYIHTLQATVAGLEDDKAVARDTLDDLMRYLCSSKFSEDPTVQVGDVLMRLQAAREALLQ